jgi:biotin operon repressor
MSKSIRQLKQRAETGISIDPDSNKGIALTFLAANNSDGYTPSEIAKRTEIPEGSVTKTMQRLAREGHTVSIDGYHFIPEDHLGDVRAALTNAHAEKALENRPREGAEWDDPDEEASEEAEALVDSLNEGDEL